MRDLAVLSLDLLTTAARLAGPGGARSVVAESLLVKQQLLILNVLGNGHPVFASPIASSRASVRSSCAHGGYSGSRSS